MISYLGVETTDVLSSINQNITVPTGTSYIALVIGTQMSTDISSVSVNSVSATALATNKVTNYGTIAVYGVPISVSGSVNLSASVAVCEMKISVIYLSGTKTSSNVGTSASGVGTFGASFSITPNNSNSILIGGCGSLLNNGDYLTMNGLTSAYSTFSPNGVFGAGYSILTTGGSKSIDFSVGQAAGINGITVEIYATPVSTSNAIFFGMAF